MTRKCAIPDVKHARIQSVRGARRLCEEAIAQMRRGLISANECNQRIRAYKQTAELILAENTMSLHGISDQELAEHPLGQDGGVAFAPMSTPKLAGVKKTTVKRGYTPKGSTEEGTTTYESVVAHDDIEAPEPIALPEPQENEGW